MKIKKLEYYDDEYKWQLEAVEFHSNLNLLVGVSGVGKTRILKSIKSLKSIANGKSLNGVRWNVCFLADDEHEYSWSGEFETKEDTISLDENSEEDKQSKILNEQLICNEDVIIKRTPLEIFFEGVKTPKLSPFESVVELLKEEDRISPIQESLDKIILTDSRSYNRFWRLPVHIVKKYENSSLASLRESGLPVEIKLAILYRMLPKEFEKIKEAFIKIFPNVLDVKVEPIKNESIPIKLSSLLREATGVTIKEKDIKYWIENISSGMFKTLMYISELYLCPENSIILIDEFENSLGVNCLDSVTDLFLSNNELQFIITSHHPYIINSVSPSYWKIVTRQGSLVTVRDAKDFHIPASRQKAFIDLINVLEDDEDLED